MSIDVQESRLPWIDEAALAAECPILWHYTKSETLVAILTSGGLLCTDYRHTNDNTELSAARTVLAGTMAHITAQNLRGEVNIRSGEKYAAFQRMPVGKLRNLAQCDAGRLFDSMLKSLPQPPHLACFASHSLDHHKKNGILTLWRGYGSTGAGIALGFDTRELIRLSNEWLKNKALHYAYLDRVVYLNQLENIEARLRDSAEFMDIHLRHLRLSTGLSDQVPLPTVREFLKFCVLVACLKDQDFEDEREIRFICTETSQEGTMQRQTADKIQSRILFPCTQALSKVMIGPSPDQAALERKVRRTLNASGYRHLGLLVSRTPFRAF